MSEAGERLHRNDDEAWRRAQLARMRQDQQVRIAARDLLDIDDVAATGRELTGMSEALLEAALEVVAPAMPFAIVGMGRFGGAEISYASDLDLLFVFDEADDAGARPLPSPCCTSCTDRARRTMSPPSTSGSDPKVAKDGWPATSRDTPRTSTDGPRPGSARPWPGPVSSPATPRLGTRFIALVDDFVWERPLTDDDVAAIRRMKARIERERIPAREDPQFHLKLGRGSLSDIEWTVQLLQLCHHVPGASTHRALEELGERGLIDPTDLMALLRRLPVLRTNEEPLAPRRRAGRRRVPGDALPTQHDQLSHLAKSLGTTPAALRDDYRRVTRRARRVVERVFYGIDGA